MNLLDRIFLFRRKISSEVRASDKCVIFVDIENRRVILKFSYAGNVQYHALDDKEAESIADTISKFVEEMKNEVQ